MRVMVDGGNWFFFLIEFVYEFDYLFIKMEVFWGLFVGDYECVEVVGIVVFEVCIE